MVWLCIGVLLFMLVHFIPSLARGLKSSLIVHIGEHPYKGLFALLLVISVALIVFGWRSTTPELVYLPPGRGATLTTILMLISVVLFGAAQYPTRIKRVVRHPQLTGMAAWSSGHLLSNGDSRSLILFGGLGLWALIEILLINRREGPWAKPDGPSLFVETRGLVISVVIFFVLVYLHPYFAGVTLIPG